MGTPKLLRRQAPTPSQPTDSSGVPTGSSTANPSNSHTSTGHSGANGVLTGEAAGIAAATFVIGIGLGLFGFWVFMKLKKRSSHNRHSGRERASSHFRSNRESSQMAVAMASEAKPDDTLLDPADSSTLQTAMAQLKDFVDQHVDNHYHEDPVNITETQIARAISECGMRNTEPGISVEELARLLRAPATRFAAARHFIAWVILSDTQLDAGQDVCLLPSYIVSFYKAFPPVERQAGCDEGVIYSLSF